jgi:hypothetical protein
VSTEVGTEGAKVGPNGAEPGPHIMRVAGVPQITIGRAAAEARAGSRISLHHKAIDSHNRLIDRPRKVGAKLAPSALLNRLPALPSPLLYSSRTFDSMTQLLFLADR